MVSDEDWLLAAQQQDSKIQNTKQILESGDIGKNREVFNSFALKGDKVYKITHYGLR